MLPTQFPLSPVQPNKRFPLTRSKPSRSPRVWLFNDITATNQDRGEEFSMKKIYKLIDNIQINPLNIYAYVDCSVGQCI